MSEGLDYHYIPESEQDDTQQETVYQKTSEVIQPTLEASLAYLRHLELQQMPMAAYDYWVTTMIDPKPIEEETVEE